MPILITLITLIHILSLKNLTKASASSQLNMCFIFLHFAEEEEKVSKQHWRPAALAPTVWSLIHSGEFTDAWRGFTVCPWRQLCHQNFIRSWRMWLSDAPVFLATINRLFCRNQEARVYRALLLGFRSFEARANSRSRLNLAVSWTVFQRGLSHLGS